MTDWNRILDEFGPVVWKQALRMLGNEHDAADCFQTVMLEAVALSRRKQVRTWPALLRRLTIVRSLDALRARYRHGVDPRPVEEVSLVGRKQGEMSARMEQDELADHLRRALSQLPVDQAEAFSLRWIDELSNGEVAERMEITANHVGVLLHRARTSLQKLLHPALESSHER